MPRERPRWWTELLLIVVVYGAYSGARLLARGDVHTAVDNGMRILRLENALWLHPEVQLNELFSDEAWLGVPSSFAYASLHYLVTPAVLVWLFRSRPLHYRLMRTWLVVSTLLGLVGFTLLPTCPPRLLPGGQGFVDSLAKYADYGWWSDDASAPSGMGDFTNQYAAMPSLHVGWSLWCGVALWHYGRGPVMRALAVAYPLITTMVVMGTGNHYFTDAVAGVAVMAIGLVLARPVLRLSDRVQLRLGLGVPVPRPAAEGIPAPATSPEASGAAGPAGRRAEETAAAARGSGTPGGPRADRAGTPGDERPAPSS